MGVVGVWARERWATWREILEVKIVGPSVLVEEGFCEVESGLEIGGLIKEEVNEM